MVISPGVLWPVWSDHLGRFWGDHRGNGTVGIRCRRIARPGIRKADSRIATVRLETHGRAYGSRSRTRPFSGKNLNGSGGRQLRDTTTDRPKAAGLQGLRRSCELRQVLRRLPNATLRLGRALRRPDVAFDSVADISCARFSSRAQGPAAASIPNVDGKPRPPSQHGAR